LEALEDRCLLSGGITLTPSEAAPQLVGEPITWTATVRDAPPSLVYQFDVGSPRGPFHVVRDFSPDDHFTCWRRQRRCSVAPRCTRPAQMRGLSLPKRALGRLEEAVASYRQALACKPDFAEAHNNLGVALQRLGRQSEALAFYREASR
jgi:hypothetical protein